MKRIVITGGLGFIGSKLVDKLIEKDYLICILDKEDVGKAIIGNANISNWIEKFHFSPNPFLDGKGHFLLNEDISSANLNEVISKTDIIVHLAANPGIQLSLENPEFDLNENFLNTFKLIECIRNSGDINKKFIFSSSAAPLAGNTIMPIDENLPCKPLAPYGASKAASEAYLHAYSNAFSLKTLVLRFSNIFGPGSISKGSVVANMVKSCIKNNEINIFGDGNQTRDFVFIDDLINVIIFGMEKYSFVDNCPIHVCSGVPTSINALASMIKEEMVSFGLSNLDICHLAPLNGDARENFSSNKKLIELCFPEVKKITKSRIKETIDFFINNFKIDY